MELNDLKKKSASELTSTSGSCAASSSICACRRARASCTQTHQLGRVRREIAQVKTLLAAKK